MCLIKSRAFSQQATYFFFQTFHKASFVLLDTELIQLATLYSNKAIKKEPIDYSSKTNASLKLLVQFSSCLKKYLILSRLLAKSSTQWRCWLLFKQIQIDHYFNISFSFSSSSRIIFVPICIMSKSMGSSEAFIVLLVEKILLGLRLAYWNDISASKVLTNRLLVHFSIHFLSLNDTLFLYFWP